jgi:hypothetical protein
VVVVVVLSFVILLPSSERLTLPETVVDEVLLSAGGGVVVLGTTTVVDFSAVLAGAGVLVFTVRSQPVRAAAPKASMAIAGRMFFIRELSIWVGWLGQ